jgi:hypothetical protein
MCFSHLSGAGIGARHLFFHPFLPPVPVSVPGQGGKGISILNSMKDFTENIRMQDFLQWTQQQKNRQHETDQQVRQQNSRQENAAEVSQEAAAIRSITKAKA